uniref:GIN domain-containing protein n=1 Tax=Pedobacter schmidteae TaxID=2201271 RepID=UPI000EAC191C|nr:DUF2807 domain-containing protein [Pedobacter schmidteae]
MKTLVKTLFASALTMLVLATSAFTSLAANKGFELSVVSPLIDFNKVIITGNVNVELVQSTRQHVVVYDNYNKSTTSVLQKGDKLFINSNEDSPITIVVYMKDLQRIDACNKVSVTTRGKFAVQALQVFLKDQASAYVNGNMGTLYTVIKDKSVLKLKGASKGHVSVKGSIAKLKTEDFMALKTASFDTEALALNDRQELPRDTVIAERSVR